MKPLTIKFFGTEVSKFKTIYSPVTCTGYHAVCEFDPHLIHRHTCLKNFPFGVLLRCYYQIHYLAIPLLKLKILVQLDYGEVIDIYPLIIYG